MFVQKFKFIVMKMHKNCCYQSCSFWLRCTKSVVGWGFAPDPTGGAYSAPPDPLAGLWVGPPGKGKEGWEGEKEGGEGVEGKGGEGVPECPNPELSSLHHGAKCLKIRDEVLMSRNDFHWFCG